MTPEWWLRVKELFRAALERPAAERAGYVAESAQGDDLMRREVESLLASHRDSDTFFERVVGDAARAAATSFAEPAAGDRVGRYELLALVARGGMGTVFRARDLVLGREVALKFLPAELAADPERLARLEREARAVAALSHPHIVALHDIGREGGTAFLVMELLDGETLASRLEGGPLPLPDVITIGTQVAAALAAAHRLGIVHRDLKPANVMLTRSGAKLLDFSIAKQQAGASGDGDGATRPPAVSAGAAAPLTAEGALVGTLQSMAPEQLEGREVDARTDVFALGALLYEMVAGRPPFDGGSPASVIASILKDQPARLTDVAPLTPAVLDRLVQRCLAKDPEQRWQSAADVGEALSWIARPAGASNPRGTVPARRHRLAGTALVVLALAAGAVVAGTLLRDRSSAGPQFTRITFGRGFVSNARFTPDGSHVVYSAAWNGRPLTLYSVGADGGDGQQLALPEAHLLSISARGELALLLRPQLRGWIFRGVLARAPLAGGAPRELLEDVEGAEWLPDGETLAVVRNDGVRARVELPPGRTLYTADPWRWIGDLRASPDGSRVAFVDHEPLGDAAGKVRVVDRGGEARTVCTTPLANVDGLIWSADGDEVLVSGGEPGGGFRIRACPLAGGERVVGTFPGEVALADSRRGRTLMSSTHSRRELVAGGAALGGESNLSWQDWTMPRALHRGLLLFEEQRGGSANRYRMYLRSLEGASAPVRLGEGHALDLSPDGRWVLYQPAGSGPLALMPTGPGASRTLPPPPGLSIFWAHFAAAGWILIEGSRDGERWLYRQEIDGGPARPLTARPVSAGVGARPLGGRPALVANLEGGGASLVPLDGGPERPLRGVEGDEWVIGALPGGSHVVALRIEGLTAAALTQVDVDSGERVPWRRLTPSDAAGVLGIGPVVLGSDGDSYAYSFRRVLSDLRVVERWD
jgi:hypothetical protein